MWRPRIRLNFLSLHYIYILSCTLIAFVTIYPYGNLRAVDAFFFAASGNTESGLNTVNVKSLKTYQQLVIYFFPIITNLEFINIIVVVVRLHWFNKRLKRLAPSSPRNNDPVDLESASTNVASSELEASTGNGEEKRSEHGKYMIAESERQLSDASGGDGSNSPYLERLTRPKDDTPPNQNTTRSITWAGEIGTTKGKAIRIPGPQDRDRGMPLEEVNSDPASDEEDLDRISTAEKSGTGRVRGRSFGVIDAVSRIPLERIASSAFVLGGSAPRARSMSPHTSSTRRPSTSLPTLSRRVTVSRNSKFENMTSKDWEELGGIEYRSLKLLLKIIICYFFGLHLLGVICLVPWIHTAPAKYTDYLERQGQDKTWWAFYSAQTMVNNLGFTLTADSMLHFSDATWPLLIMTFLAYAGNTFYPIFLRLVIWTSYHLTPKTSKRRQSLRFLLDHPRRCYTLLFPSNPTWILFGILFVLNFIDVLLIVVLDLDNAAVNYLPPGPRVLASIFQSASSRHTGTATFNLYDVNPAVQFSLMVMMYIAIYPIAMSVRASNTYEERSLGKMSGESQLRDDQSSSTYLMNHIRNQLSFDLWYIFIGVFCICIAEANRIADFNDHPFSVFSVFFEVVSGYANVGLSLGYPSGWTSLSGKFTTFSKVVICIMMIRGRHRGLPYAIDRAIMLPGDDFADEGASTSKND